VPPHAPAAAPPPAPAAGARASYAHDSGPLRALSPPQGLDRKGLKGPAHPHPAATSGAGEAGAVWPSGAAYAAGAGGAAPLMGHAPRLAGPAPLPMVPPPILPPPPLAVPPTRLPTVGPLHALVFANGSSLRGQRTWQPAASSEPPHRTPFRAPSCSLALMRPLQVAGLLPDPSLRPRLLALVEERARYKGRDPLA